MMCLYIARCAKGYLYTGITNNIEKRLVEHQEGKCPLTKNRQPIELVHTEELSDRISAARREKEIKGWSRKKKELLISNNKSM
jgi:putative endonuclease